MRIETWYLSVVFASLVSLGCGGRPLAGSCTFTSGSSGEPSYCIESREGFTTSGAQSTCSALRGTFSTGECSSVNRAGRCEVNSAGYVLVTHYYSPSTTTEQAQQSCASNP